VHLPPDSCAHPDLSARALTDVGADAFVRPAEHSEAYPYGSPRTLSPRHFTRAFSRERRNRRGRAALQGRVSPLPWGTAFRPWG